MPISPSGIVDQPTTDNGVVERFDQDDPTQLYAATPNFPVLLEHHPGQYQLATEGFDHPTIVPQMTFRSTEPGVAGVEQRNGTHKQESDRWAMAVMRTQRRGATVIDPSKFSYVKSWPCRSRSGVVGKFYGTIWQRPQVVPGQETRFPRDQAAYNRWLLERMDEGVIPRPHVQHLEPMVERAREKVARLEGSINLQPGVRAELVKQANDELKAVAAAVERALNPEPPAAEAKPTRASRKAD